MCVPVAVGLAAAATALTAGSQIYAGNVRTAQLRYESKVAAQNAALARGQAKDALDRGVIDQVQQGRKTGQIVGAQRAALSANGIEADFGSAAAVQNDARLIGWEDAATLRANTLREVKGYEISSANALSQSRAKTSEANSQGLATALTVGGTLLSGATQISKMGK